MMVSVQTLSQPLAADDRYQIRIEGQEYPRTARAARSLVPRESRMPELVARLPMQTTANSSRTHSRRHKQTLAEEMLVRAWNRLPLAHKTLDDFQQSEEIVRCFVKSHERLSQMAAQARKLLETVCRFHFKSVRDQRLDAKMQQEAEAAKFRQIMNFTMPSASLGEELDATTVVQQPAEVMQQMKKSLAQSMFDMVDSFYTALEQLVDKEVMGVIDWRGDSVCKFHFFRRVLTHKLERITTDVEVETLWRDLRNGNRERREDITTTTTTESRRTYEHIRFEEQLMNAEKLTLDDPNLVIPRHVQPVVDAIPAWLTPLTRAAVGECFKERIIRHVENEDHMEDTRVTREVIEHPARHYDPALAVGHFVLVGWGRQEHEVELAHRNVLVCRRLSCNKAKDAVGMAALGYAFATVLVLLSLVFFPKLLWAAVGVFLVALVPLNVAIANHAKSQGRKPSGDSYFFANLGGFFLILATLSALLAATSRDLFPVGVTLVFLCFFVPICIMAVRSLSAANPKSSQKRSP